MKPAKQLSQWLLLNGVLEKITRQFLPNGQEDSNHPTKKNSQEIYVKFDRNCDVWFEPL